MTGRHILSAHRVLAFSSVALLLAVSSCKSDKTTLLNIEITAEYMLDDTTRCIVYKQNFCTEKHGEKIYTSHKDSAIFHILLPFTYNIDYEEGLAFIRRNILNGEFDVEHLNSTPF